MTPQPPLSASYFDAWYADMPANPVKDRIQQRHLGLPPGILSTSALPWGRHRDRGDGATALPQARDNAARRGVAAEFRVGTLEATGLGGGSVDAVLCIDSIQFATDPSAAYDEVRRVLAPSGRVMLSSWEAVDRDTDRLPERLLAVDLGVGLTQAGFTDVLVKERPDWRAIERGMWEEAAALDPAGDPALQSFHDEGVRSLAIWDLLRRVTATATAP